MKSGPIGGCLPCNLIFQVSRRDAMSKRSAARRVLAGLLVLLLLGLLAGCGGAAKEQKQQPPAQEKPKVKAGIMFSIVNPARAGGWDRADWAGIEALRNEYGWEVTVGEGVPYAQTAATAAGYAEKGYDLVIFPDAGQTEAFREVAPKYPKTWFVMMSMCDNLPNSPRVAAWSPDLYAYGEMVGLVAAKATKSGTIGLIGGVPVPALVTLFSGAIEAAKFVRPDVKVLTYFVGDWVDVAKHRELAALQIQQGADVIFPETGPGTLGCYEAAQAGGAKIVGFAWDMYEDAPKVMLTSVIINKPRMYKDLAEQFMSGKLEKKIVNCGAEYFGLSDFRGSLPEETVKEIQDLVAKLQKGELPIPVVIHEEIMKK